MDAIKNYLKKLAVLAAMPVMSLALVTIASAADNYNQSDPSNYNTNDSGNYSQSDPGNYNMPCGGGSCPMMQGGDSDNYNSSNYTSSNAPNLFITNTDNTSVKLRVSYPNMANQSAIMVLGVWNEDSNMTAIRNINVNFDQQGNANVSADNLKPGNTYAFFVKIQMSGGNLSDSSNTVTAKTM